MQSSVMERSLAYDSFDGVLSHHTPLPRKKPVSLWVSRLLKRPDRESFCDQVVFDLCHGVFTSMELLSKAIMLASRDRGGQDEYKSGRNAGSGCTPAGGTFDHQVSHRDSEGNKTSSKRVPLTIPAPNAASTAVILNTSAK